MARATGRGEVIKLMAPVREQPGGVSAADRTFSIHRYMTSVAMQNPSASKRVFLAPLGKQKRTHADMAQAEIFHTMDACVVVVVDDAISREERLLFVCVVFCCCFF